MIQETRQRKHTTTIFTALRGQEWVAAVCLHCERGPRQGKGYRTIAEVLRNIEAEQATGHQDKAAA